MTNDEKKNIVHLCSCLVCFLGVETIRIDQKCTDEVNDTYHHYFWAQMKDLLC